MIGKVVVRRVGGYDPGPAKEPTSGRALSKPVPGTLVHSSRLEQMAEEVTCTCLVHRQLKHGLLELAKKAKQIEEDANEPTR